MFLNVVGLPGRRPRRVERRGVVEASSAVAAPGVPQAVAIGVVRRPVQRHRAAPVHDGGRGGGRRSLRRQIGPHRDLDRHRGRALRVAIVGDRQGERDVLRDVGLGGRGPRRVERRGVVEGPGRAGPVVGQHGGVGVARRRLQLHLFAPVHGGDVRGHLSGRPLVFPHPDVHLRGVREPPCAIVGDGEGEHDVLGGGGFRGCGPGSIEGRGGVEDPTARAGPAVGQGVALRIIRRPVQRYRAEPVHGGWRSGGRQRRRCGVGRRRERAAARRRPAAHPFGIPRQHPHLIGRALGQFGDCRCQGGSGVRPIGEAAAVADPVLHVVIGDRRLRVRRLRPGHRQTRRRGRCDRRGAGRAWRPGRIVAHPPAGEDRRVVPRLVPDWACLRHGVRDRHLLGDRHCRRKRQRYRAPAHGDVGDTPRGALHRDREGVYRRRRGLVQRLPIGQRQRLAIHHRAPDLWLDAVHKVRPEDVQALRSHADNHDSTVKERIVAPRPSVGPI